MMYLYITILLFVSELLYFKVAARFNIIDKPNERSSHERITLRGGGVIFYIGIFLYFILSGFQYPYFFLGLTFVTFVSFVDDVIELSNRVRLTVQGLSVLVMAYQLDVYHFPWIFLLIAFITIIGMINAYNFMDGINGITASYSMAVVALLAIVNHSIGFIDQDLIIVTLIATGIFAFFNFRTSAKCFAGDVGSVAVAYIVIFMIGSLILHTQNLIYVLFLTVYGIDTFWTIAQRLVKEENIFLAHRTHLYQYLGNEAGVNKLVVSFIYGALQFGIGVLVLAFADQDVTTQIVFALSLLIGLSILYLIFKSYVLKKYVEKCDG